ncbi:DUF6529 family protein [Actinophytocola oryzae]|uniref:Uncharacterized protein n=1 Tax=Actinophytocola oryzae TaxID=502181 RepID=A0A4V3FUJ2_9PSEU|nr:DUF6529 family protein [Actinophytocola oryzae]TDV55411.1 hypothetical protein CLV71_103652 [Actinophytocola oryzae]
MTLPPDFGPSGRPPDHDLTDLNEFPDLTQPVPGSQTGFPTHEGQQWVTATNVPALSFDDEEPDHEQRGIGGVIAALAIGALVAIALGAYGKMHEPTGEALNLAGFSSGIAAKAWLGSVAVVLAIVQVLSAMAMWGRLPGWTAGHGTAVMHRWSGRIAVIVSLPVAAHCLYALGFQTFDTRVLLHSLFGCFFYGLFVCKMVVLTRSRTPGWVLPVVGSAVFTGLVGLWVTSSLWFFSEYGVSF